MTTTSKTAFALVLNLLTVVLVFLSVLSFFVPVGFITGEGNMTGGGAVCFRYFTIDSNILAALAALILAGFQLRTLVSGRAVPRWVLLFKYVGTVAVTETMMVVLLFLGLTMGYGPMFAETGLELHLICPVAAILSFVLFEPGVRLSKKLALWGILPSLVYGVVYLTNVIFRAVWPDFYGFNIGGFWYVSFLVVPAATYGFALILGALHNKAQNAD